MITTAFESTAMTASPRAPATPEGEYFPRTSVRVRAANLNHHLWNNNGTWYLHYTMHPTPLTKARVRESLSTKSLETARQKRDAFFARVSTRS